MFYIAVCSFGVLEAFSEAWNSFMNKNIAIFGQTFFKFFYLQVIQIFCHQKL